MINLFPTGTVDFFRTGTPVKAISCILTIEINSTWSVELSVPINEQGSDLIDYGAFIEIPSPYGYQLYSIVDYKKTTSKITCTGYPIAMVLLQKSIFHYDTRPIDMSCENALKKLIDPINNIKSNTFVDTSGQTTTLNGLSNIDKEKTAYWQLMTGIDALNGDNENSLINRWGGEIKWDNFDIQVLDHLGQTSAEREWEYPITIGFNCTGMDIQYDYSSVVTRVIPKAYNGYLLPAESDRYVESPKEDKPKFPIYKVIEYPNIKYIDDASNSEDADEMVFNTFSSMYAYMRQVAMNEFKVNHIDDPSFVCNVSIIDLYQVPKYKDFKDSLKLSLGDYLTVYNEDLKVETEARVTKLKYDCILEQTTEITIGSVGKNFFSSTTDLNRTVSKVISTSKSGVQMDSATGILHGLDKGTIATGTPIKEGSDTWWDIDNGSASFGQEVTFKGQINTSKNIYAGGNIYLQDIDSEGGYKYGHVAIGRYDASKKTADSSSIKNSPGLQMQSSNSDSMIAISTNIYESGDQAYVRAFNQGGTTYSCLFAGNAESSASMSVVDVRKDFIRIAASQKIQVYCNGRLGYGLTGTFNNVTGLTVIGGFVTGVKTES